jgi:hypothetical protein
MFRQRAITGLRRQFAPRMAVARDAAGWSDVVCETHQFVAAMAGETAAGAAGSDWNASRPNRLGRGAAQYTPLAVGKNRL